MSDAERDAYLARMYYETSDVGSYSGLKGFSLAIKKDGKFKFTKAQIEEWLRNQDAFSLQKPVRYKFKRSRIVTTGIDRMWDMDLGVFQQLSS
jgi:hypothetical protein